MTERDTELAPSTRRSEWRKAPAVKLHPGDVLGERYRVQEKLGEGAMGSVYLAYHRDLKREVAIKVLKPEAQANLEYSRRFRREARATSQLDHPHIVRVIDFGHRPALFLVMEYIRGETLAQYLRGLETPPPLEFVLRVVDQMLSALDAAHNHGIIHRDLKPDNVLLTRRDDEPFVKVVDFGLAHFEDEFDAGPTLTRQDIVAGTPAYMSPEQCQSMAVTSASDLYSIGCILTELLQLSPPYDGDSAAVLMAQQMFSPPPPLIRPADAEPVPAWLDDLRLELLAKHSHRRPDSARATRERILLGRGSAPPADRTSSRGSLTPGAPKTEPRGDGSRLALSVVNGKLDAAVKAGLAMHGIDVGQAEGAMILLMGEQELATTCQQVMEWSKRGRSVVACLEQLRAKDLPSLVEAGVADVVSKPIDPVRLARVVQRAHRRQERRRKSG